MENDEQDNIKRCFAWCSYFHAHRRFSFLIRLRIEGSWCPVEVRGHWNLFPATLLRTEEVWIGKDRSILKQLKEQNSRILNCGETVQVALIESGGDKALWLYSTISDNHKFFVRTPFWVFLDSIESLLSLESTNI